jgi:hypothetical protein
VFFYLLSTTLIGFLLATVLIIGHGLTIVGHPGLFVFLILFFTCGAGLGGLFLFRQLLYGILKDRLAVLELHGNAARNILEHSMYRMSLKDLAARVRELLQEEVIAAENSIHRRHIVAGQYGLGVPASQMEKILEDEGFYGLYGRSREAFVILPFCHFPAAVIQSLEPEAYHALFQAVLKKTLELSRQSGFLLAEFSPRMALLCSDLPYASEKRDRHRLFGYCSKWKDAVAEILGGHSPEWCASLVVHYGIVHAGLVPVGDAGQYSIIGPAVDQVSAFIRRTARAGLYLSADAMAQLKIDAPPDGWEHWEGSAASL